MFTKRLLARSTPRAPRDEASRLVATSSLDEIRELLGKVLHLGKRTATLSAETRLFGSLPELDSMAVIMVVVEIEERFGITFDDEQVTAETFETVGSLASAVDRMRCS